MLARDKSDQKVVVYARTRILLSLLRGQILGADSESEVIFYIGGQYQADIGHFLQFCL